MKRYLVRDTTMTAIADAVRNKTGTSDALGPIDMAEKIATIRVYEGDPTLIGVTITPTGTEIVKVPPNGVDGFGIVTVEGDVNLVPENIKEGASIYGVDGTYREEVLDTSDATAEASDILEGFTAYVNGELITGTHVCTSEGIDTSDATAEASDILEGATAYVNGKLIIGTHVCMADPILSPLIVTPTGSEFVETPEDGVDGFSEVTVEGDDNLVPENILKGVTIYGVTGTAETSKPGGGSDNPDPGQPETNYELQTKDDIIPGTANVIVTPDEDYYGLKRVTVNGDAALIPENIKEGISIFGVAGTLKSGEVDLTSGLYGTHFKAKVTACPPEPIVISGMMFETPDIFEAKISFATEGA